MVESPVNIAASIRQRLLNLARQDQKNFDVVLLAYALERLIFRLSISEHGQNFMLKGGMLVTLWTVDQNRFTRDVDFLSFGPENEELLINTFSQIMSIDAGDGLRFDISALTAAQIRDDQVYGGVRLKTTAYLDKVRIPITVDIGFGDAVAEPKFTVEYPSLLDLPSAHIRAYSPATVIAEKFQAVVALGFINSRMKDYYDLWAIQKAKKISIDDLSTAIKITFTSRKTVVPSQRPDGLSKAFATDPRKSRQWLAYANSIEFEDISLEQLSDEIWAYLKPVCTNLLT